jgi:hypothetical protein
MRTIHTTADLEVTPDIAWEVLTDFPAHAGWNPFMTSIAGEASLGTRLTVQLSPPGGRGMTFKPTVTAAEPGYVLEWLGHLGMPGLFDGRHRFELEALPAGGTRLTHSETFRGVLVRPLWRSVAGPTTAGFEQFNAAFEERCRLVATGRRTA